MPEAKKQAENLAEKNHARTEKEKAESNNRGSKT